MRKGRKALGKGLGALIPGAPPSRPVTPINRDYLTVPIERIHPQANQPRRKFDEAALQGLCESIQEQGLIEPPVVRRKPGTDGFELIVGERRWRAAQKAGLKEIPVVIKDASDADAFEMALVENVQREDLNAIEEAEALHYLIEERGYTQAEVASRIGRNRSTVANSLRLLGLPPQVRELVIDNKLSEGHARAVLQAGTPAKMTALARAAVARGYSVRETERRARAAANEKDAGQKKQENEQSPEVKALVEKLQRAVGARVNIEDKKGKGRIVINYTNYDELDSILNKILT